MSLYYEELKKLTPKGRKLVQSCYDANPNGCRGADGECSPPCYSQAGLSWQGWKAFVDLQREKKAATPLEGFE
jgi:hypothetical protein